MAIFALMWRKHRTRTEKNTVLLLAFSCLVAGIGWRKEQPVEALIVSKVADLIQFLFVIDHFIMGFCSIGLIIHAIDRLRKRPESRKYWVMLVIGIVTVLLLILTLANTWWIQNEGLFILEILMDYSFLYFVLTFLIFLVMVISSRVISPSLNKSLIIVLGTGLTADGAVSVMLRNRLDKAIQFRNNQLAKGITPATFLVTGGRGPGKSTSEAAVMAEYLVAKGIPQNQIILEDKSINTHQNFLYSQRLLEHKEQILFVTSSFHVLRGKVYANQLGLGAEGIGAKTPLYYLPYALLREYLALFLIYRNFHMMVLGLFLLIMYIFMN